MTGTTETTDDIDFSIDLDDISIAKDDLQSISLDVPDVMDVPNIPTIKPPSVSSTHLKKRSSAKVHC